MIARTEDQYILRIKRNSELDKAMRYLEPAGIVPVSTISDITGRVRSYSVLNVLSKNCDNLYLDTSLTPNGYMVTMRYVDVNPGVPVSIGQDILPAVFHEQGMDRSEQLGLDVRWPQAPPIVNSIGAVFRKPSWYDTMKTMVSLGRHIALSGPPGVGKDTAVQELAAREGRILVTIGGDGGFRRRDLVGSLQIAAGKSFFDVAEYAAAAVYGWWVLLTEVNAADADALLYINAQLAAPYIVTVAGKAYPVHPDFRLFVTYNPGLVGTKPLPQAFKDRFFSIKVPFFNQSELQRILIAHGAADDEVTKEVALFGVQLWNLHERGQIRYQVTTRRLMDAIALLQSNVVSTTLEALDMAVISAVDSPVEAGLLKNVLNSFRSGY